MTQQKMHSFKLNSVLGFLLFTLFLVALFYLLRGLIFILSWTAPLLLVAAFIIRRQVVINYGKWIVKSLRKNPLFGIVAIVFTVLGYMIVFPFLFLKAIFLRKVDNIQQQQTRQQQGEFVDYEEVGAEEMPDDAIELPKLQERLKKYPEKKDNPYDKLFRQL